MQSEHRFRGAMSEEYRLLRLALPHFDELQRLVGAAVAVFAPPDRAGPVHILEIGCGNGVTTHVLLGARPDAVVTTLDNEEKMTAQAAENLAEFIRQGRCRVIRRDALEELQARPAASFAIVASALTLHNLRHDYRHALHREIHRVLKPGGLFVNADKYAEGDEQRFRALQVALGRFFDAFVPLGKLDLLRDWVLHNVADQGPERVLKEEEALRELREIGFRDVAVRDRHNMEAVLTAFKTA